MSKDVCTVEILASLGTFSS